MLPLLWMTNVNVDDENSNNIIDNKSNMNNNNNGCWTGGDQSRKFSDTQTYWFPEFNPRRNVDLCKLRG